MPYLILAIGLAIGAFALYRFFIAATPAQIKAFFLTALLIVLAIALFAMAFTGRLPAALGLLAALTPFVIHYLRNAAKARKHSRQHVDREDTAPMTRVKALEILGISEPASDEDIQTAYKSLMRKLHPDNKGSGWMAARLNEARDYLLKQRT